jgi:hypothetical protein
MFLPVRAHVDEASPVLAAVVESIMAIPAQNAVGRDAVDSVVATGKNGSEIVPPVTDKLRPLPRFGG